jgi:hypothetical protein
VRLIFRRIHGYIHFEVIALICGLLVSGYMIGGDFGMSWDEPDNSRFGQQAVQAYLQLKPPEEWHSNLESKGPFYVAVSEILSKYILSIRASWLNSDARHYAYFLSLPIATAALFSISNRITNRKSALVASLLFTTQPLIFGHAFINPKDTPFMAFFLLTVSSGLFLIDRVASSDTNGGSKNRMIITAILAGGILGITTSIRLFGPFAGLLVSGLGLIKFRKRFILPLILYWASALLTSYLTWPYLWGDPINRFRQSLLIMMSFPWDNLVLYRGLLYPAPVLPWHFLPFTILIQLTEPAILLAIAGSIVALIKMCKDRRKIPIFVLLFVWTCLPIFASLILHTTVYDNSRQFLFAFPPLFIISALAFDMIFTQIHRRWLQSVIVFLTILPGMIWIIRLHPYEYIYYNNLVGGVQGAYREYELDYWTTSYREAMEKVNEFAPQGASVEVRGPWKSAAEFARPDLIITGRGNPLPQSANPPMYLIVSTRSNIDQRTSPEAPIIAEVHIEGATLAVIKSLLQTEN